MFIRYAHCLRSLGTFTSYVHQDHSPPLFTGYVHSRRLDSHWSVSSHVRSFWAYLSRLSRLVSLTEKPCPSFLSERERRVRVSSLTSVLWLLTYARTHSHVANTYVSLVALSSELGGTTYYPVLLSLRVSSHVCVCSYVRISSLDSAVWLS